MRSIRKIVKADKVNMGGIILDQPLPHRGIDQISPFLLIHHWDDKLPGGKIQLLWVLVVVLQQLPLFLSKWTKGIVHFFIQQGKKRRRIHRFDEDF